MLSDEIRILAIETTTSLMGVAVTVGEEVVSEGFVDKPKVHSYKLLPMCDWVLRKAKTDPLHISAVAVSAGPGSFTGLRIGCATAQGLSHAWGKRVVPVPTFSVLLEQARKETQGVLPDYLVAAIQGRARAQTVTALYSRDGAELIPPEGKSLEQFALEVSSIARLPVVAVGDAAGLFAEYVRSESTGKFSEVEVAMAGERTCLPLPGTVGRLAARMMREGLSVEPKAAIPLYYRKHQAEVALTRKRTNERRD